MSSVSVNNKTKITPLNLTYIQQKQLSSETVYKILKQVPKIVPSNRKIYPTVKYTTEQIRSTTDIKNNIFKKIKQLQRFNSQHKRPKLRPNLCRTQVSHQGVQSVSKNKNSIQKIKKVDNQQDTANIKPGSGRKTNALEKSAADKYYEKINKMKNLKLKQYMRNKFAIDIKAIQTARQDINIEQQDKLSPISPFKPKRFYKPQTLFSAQKNSQYVVDMKQDNTQYVEDLQKFEQIMQKKQTSDLQLKIQKFMKKSEKLQKTQVLDKIFTFTREFQEHPADIRFVRMKIQLNLFLLSFGCMINSIPKQLPIYTRYCFKYKFYVGPGNNKNLIISLMKKRWWWTQTNSMQDAHFIWTQLKQSKVLQNCNKFTQQPLPPKNIKLPEKLQCSTKNLRNKPNQNRQKKQKLFHQKSSIKQSQQFLQIKQQRQLIQIIHQKKLHNHYQGNSVLGNKKALFYYISQYCDHKNIDRYNYIPLTFHIQNLKDPQIKKLQICIKNSPSSFWLLKPGQNSNRGNGISVTRSLSQIKQRIKNLTKNTLIVQKYIDNIFLYKHRKFDIRTYMVAITIGGSTKFYWHSQGYLRTSSYVFNLQQHDNLLIHLTNDAIQSTNQNYSKYEEGNKLSYQQFQRYLDSNYRNKAYLIKQAHQQMKNIAKLAVQATYCSINISKLQNCFEIFGLDFILDHNFKPWLIEVNTNPCLQLSAPSLQRLIPQMVQNSFRLGLDPIFQPCVQFPRTMSSYIPDNIFANNKFSIIFDDFFDRDFEWQNKIKQTKVGFSKDQEGCQQVFEGDGQILNDV